MDKDGPPFLAMLYVVEGDLSAVSRWITVVHRPTTAGLFQARYQPVGQGGTYSYIMSEPRWFKSEQDVHRWIKRIVAGYDRWFEEKKQ